MEELITGYKYGDFKMELDRELNRTADSFVRIGYLLKLARDTNVLAESKYKSVTEFAQQEYGLDKTQVSRFISINERFANGGEFLLPEYQTYGYAKLTIMLQIPEEITQELTPEYTKAEIQAVKEELDEEKKVSDLEILMEEKKDEEETVLFRTIKQLGHDDPALYVRLWTARVHFLTWEEVGPILAPSGDKVYSVRIPGAGRVMMTMQDGKDKITITNTRTFEKVIATRQDVANELVRILREAETAREAWEKVYLKPWPLDKVAPVQQEEAPKPAKKESRVTKAKKPEKPKKPSTEPDLKKPKTEEKADGERDDQQEAAGLETGNDQPELSGGSRDHGAAGGSADAYGSTSDGEGLGGDTVQGYNEGAGDPEGDGQGGDNEGDNEDFKRLMSEANKWFMELVKEWPDDPTLIKRERLRPVYNMTIHLAAAVEEAINLGAENEE